MRPLSLIVLRALVALLVLAAGGFALDRGTRAFAGLAPSTRAPFLVLAGVVLAYLALLSPVLAVAAIALAVATRKRSHADTLGPAPRTLLAPFALLAAVAAARPLVPVYWDEFVWFTKAAIEGRGGWGALRAAALARDGDVFPPEYPLLASLVPAWLAGGHEIPALAIGFTFGKLLPLACFLVALAALPRGRAPLLFGIAAPIVIVHLRSQYADLPTGLFAGALLATLLPGGPRWPTAVPVLLALATSGLKDEGTAHVLAIAFGTTLVGGRAALKRAAPAALAAVVAFAWWRATLAAHGVAATDHMLTLQRAGLLAAPTLLAELGRSAIDVWSWGVAWPVVITAAVFALSAGPPNARAAGLALLAELGVLMLGIVLGPDRVRAFALGGTVMNRVLVQLLPPAVVLLWTLAPRATQASPGAEPQVR